jgi:hypothetical protein
MTILRFLNPQGIVGIAASLCLSVLLLVQKGETSHWKKQSRQFEQLYHAEQAAFVTTVSNYRAAADAARAADQAGTQRVAAEQRAIHERTQHDFETRLAAARAAAERLRDGSHAAADPGVRRNAPVPGLSASTGGSAQDSDENRLPASDALTATEQAIQLDELIKWVRAQAEVDPNGPEK